MSTGLNNESFCTIITENYIHYALALNDSLLKHSGVKRILYVLVATDPSKERALLPEKDTIQYLYVDELCNDGEGKLIYDKYFHTYMDGFRWSMKPVLLKFLIQHKNCEKLLFLDCDLYFFYNYDFLFEKLTTSDILLTPHWRPADPKQAPDDFHVLLQHGLFNAGFVGVNKNSVDALVWWAKACEHACEVDLDRGIYVDQAYLNALPVLFNNVEIIKHQGCNVAEWNIADCQRIVDENGDVLINNQYPVIFIHFTTRTAKRIADGRDPFLIKYLSEYVLALFKHNKDYNILLRATKAEPDIVEKFVYVGFINRLYSKLNWKKKFRN